jgi:hypothetical protein
MASTHPLPRSSTVAHVPSAVGVDGLRTMRLHRVLDQMLTVSMRRPYWSDMARRSQRPRLAQCADVRWETPVSRALMSGLCRGACRWPSWVCACVPGTNLKRVLVAQNHSRYCLDCLDHSLSHHAGQRLLPEPPGLRPPPTSSAGASRFGGRSRLRTPLRLVGLAARHHRPGDARHLVRQRHRRQPHRTPLQHPTQPGPGGAVPLRRPVHH